MKIYFFLLVVLFVLSCKDENKIPKDVIAKNRMQELLWDMSRADAFLTNFAGKNDTTFNRAKETVALYKQVFQVHQTTREEFKKSLEWYQQHPAVMKIILDTLQTRQSKIIQERSKPKTFPADTLRLNNPS
jgi:hypothetical protein